jgi:hypothetical protein
MTDRPTPDVPEPVRKIVNAMVGRALVRCDRLGIAHVDFYRALREERRLRAGCGVVELIEGTFRRLGATAN